MLFFSIIKGPVKINLLPNIFELILKIQVNFQAYKYLYSSKKWDTNRKKIEKKICFRIKSFGSGTDNVVSVYFDDVENWERFRIIFVVILAKGAFTNYVDKNR